MFLLFQNLMSIIFKARHREKHKFKIIRVIWSSNLLWSALAVKPFN
jgi:hypothetical protein